MRAVAPPGWMRSPRRSTPRLGPWRRLRAGILRIHLHGIRRDRGDLVARELVDVATGDRGHSVGTGVAGEVVDGDGVGAGGDHASVVSGCGALEAFQRFAAGLP